MSSSLRVRFTRRRAPFWLPAASASILLAGLATPVGAGPPADDVGNVDSRSFDVDRIPASVLDDDTVEVTDDGLIIAEPEPFAGWPSQIVEQTIGVDAWDGTSESPSASEAFTLHSLPGADQTIYLDFNGHTTAGTAWNTGGRPASFTSAPYSRDSNPAFNTAELQYIGEIWERVAEDYAPFDVDVTTEAPAFNDLWRSSTSDTRYGTQVVISPTQDWYGSSGGVAYVGSFSWSNERTPSGDPVVTPAFVFSDALAGGVAKYVAEAASHEAGHTLSLYHDGKGSSEYYGGHSVAGSSSDGWAPIMGVGYQRNVTQWSNGAYPDATQTQDDVAILASRLGWASSGSSVVGPDTLFDGQTLVGTVERSTVPVDVEIVVAAGTSSVTIVPDVASSNLLATAQLLNGSTVIATASPTQASGWQLQFDETLGAGTYVVRLSSIGWGSVTSGNLTGFTSYGSLGRFRMSLDVTPDNSTVTTPPTTATPTSSGATTTTTVAPPTTAAPPITTAPPTTVRPTTTRPTTAPPTTVPSNNQLTTSGPAGCGGAARGGLIGFSEQQAAAPCFSPARRLG